MKIRPSLMFSLPSLCLLAFLGCDYAERRQLDRERADGIYKTAMADYTAGRLDQATEGLLKVVRAAPGNVSARFQLACLLQDYRKDYLGAICNYREFIQLDPDGDRSELAKDRIAKCERFLAPELVRKLNLDGTASLQEANAALAQEMSKLRKMNEDLTKRFERAMARAEQSAAETERMRKMLHGEVAEDPTRPVIPSEAALLDDEENAGFDRIKFSEDVKNLVVEEKNERNVMPFEAVSDRSEKPAEKPKSDEPAHEPRPPEYVVQDGDTLYKLAIRFYGRRGAWVLIREANKAVVSTDGRVKVGQKLKLP